LSKVTLFFPEAWHRLVDGIAPSQRENILDYYAKLVFDDDTAISIPAAIRWNAFESSIMSLLPKADGTEPSSQVQTNAAAADSTPAKATAADGPTELARARVQIHYIEHLCFIDGEQLLQLAATTLRQIPTTIVQGRYDMVCPPQTAWQLAQAIPHASLVMVADAGHSAMEQGTCQALLAATERYKALVAA
jgi:proline iminopeptidase